MAALSIQEILDEFEYDLTMALTRLRERLTAATALTASFSSDDGITRDPAIHDVHDGQDVQEPDPPSPVTVTLAEFTTALRSAVQRRYPNAAPGTDYHIGVIHAYVQGLYDNGLSLAESLRYLIGMLDKLSSRRSADPSYTYHIASLASATTKVTVSEFISEVEIFWKRSSTSKGMAIIEMAQDNERLESVSPPPPPAPASLAAKTAAMRSTITALTGRTSSAPTR
jgi:hypothetical protein